jgi:hypothetical protein
MNKRAERFKSNEQFIWSEEDHEKFDAVFDLALGISAKWIEIYKEPTISYVNEDINRDITYVTFVWYFHEGPYTWAIRLEACSNSRIDILVSRTDYIERIIIKRITKKKNINPNIDSLFALARIHQERFIKGVG